jgi:hypothetical protein
VAGVLLPGCTKPDDSLNGVSMQLELQPRPPRAGVTTFTIKLTNPRGQPIVAAHVAIEADMSHPGMAPVFGQATEAQPGVYRSQLKLTMAGDWVLVAHITLASGEKVDRQSDIRGVRPN